MSLPLSSGGTRARGWSPALASLGQDFARIIYVDSGSTDGSVEAARNAGAEVVVLDTDRPFTAARARNAGIAALKTGRVPDFVQFIDGDCVLNPDWTAKALAFLYQEEKVAAVCGRLRERFPEVSIYNRLCDEEWDTPIGEAKACGGIALMRFKAFQDVNGFNPDLIAGEEPEMCLRMRRLGWKIWRLDAEMALHDAAILRFGQFWKRARRGGYAYAQGAAMYGRAPERHGVAGVRRILIWGAMIPCVDSVWIGYNRSSRLGALGSLPASGGPDRPPQGRHTGRMGTGEPADSREICGTARHRRLPLAALAGPRCRIDRIQMKPIKAKLKGLMPGQKSLGSRVLQAGGWSIVQIVSMNILRLASNLILTRYLAPEAFGVMAMIGTLLAAFNLFTDIGLSQSITRDKDGEDDHFLRVAWTIKLCRGAAIAGCVLLAALGLWAIAPSFAPPGTIYADPRLPLLVAISALTPLIIGAESTSKELALRRLQNWRFTIIGILAQVLSLHRNGHIRTIQPNGLGASGGYAGHEYHRAGRIASVLSWTQNAFGA